MEKIVSVDCGRSAVKIAHWDNGVKTDYFYSKHSKVNVAYLKKLTVINFNKATDIICSVDNSDNVYVVGEACEKFMPPDKIQYATNDDIYIEYAVFYVLVAIARVVSNNSSVILSFNFTFNNFSDSNKEKLKNYIVGKHTVKFYDTKLNVISEINFEVSKITILFQSWASLMYMLVSQDCKSLNDEYTKDNLIIDVGRKTIDVTYNRKLVSVKGMSYDTGVEKIYEDMAKKLKEDYGIKKRGAELEHILQNKEEIYTKTGEKIDIVSILKDSIKDVCIASIENILEDFGDYTYYKVLLTGGGMVYYKDYFQKYFQNLHIIDNYVYSNAVGMLKFMVYNILYNK